MAWVCEQARQCAFLFFLEYALCRGCSGEESIENHHSAHDGTDNTEQEILAFRLLLLRADPGADI